jgi:hypothetical protein
VDDFRLLDRGVRASAHVFGHLDVRSTGRHFVVVWVLGVEISHAQSADGTGAQHGQRDGETHRVLGTGVLGPKETSVDTGRVAHGVDECLGNSTFLGGVGDDVTGPDQDERGVGVDEGNTEAEEDVLDLAVLRGDQYGETSGTCCHGSGNVERSFLEAIRGDGNDQDTDNSDHVDLWDKVLGTEVGDGFAKHSREWSCTGRSFPCSPCLLPMWG